MVEYRSKSADDLRTMVLTNIGELTVGGTDRIERVLIAALANMNDPYVNEVLLAYKVRFSDRFTKTRIFPREGMSLPNGEVYSEPPKEEVIENEKLTETE